MKNLQDAYNVLLVKYRAMRNKVRDLELYCLLLENRLKENEKELKSDNVIQ